MIYIRLSKLNVIWSNSQSQNEMIQYDQTPEGNKGVQIGTLTRKKPTLHAIHLPAVIHCPNVHHIKNYFLCDFSILSLIELPLYVYAYLCTFFFYLFQMLTHYWGHFRITAISCTVSFVFYFYHSIVIGYVKLSTRAAYCGFTQIQN